MNPTLEQLNDPQWWSDNVKDEYDHAFTTAPKWDGLDGMVGTFQFASEDGDMGGGESLCVDENGWILICKRPTKAFVPEVGDSFEFSMNGVSWEQRTMLYVDEYSVFMCNKKYPANRWHYKKDDPDLMLRPIKSEREKFVEIVGSKQLLSDVSVDDLAGALYDAGCRFVEAEK